MGANENFISHKFIKDLVYFLLNEPYQYTNFNAKIHLIDIVVEANIKLGDNKILVRLLVENEKIQSLLEIMLGTNFRNKYNHIR